MHSQTGRGAITWLMKVRSSDIKSSIELSANRESTLATSAPRPPSYAVRRPNLEREFGIVPSFRARQEKRDLPGCREQLSLLTGRSSTARTLCCGRLLEPVAVTPPEIRVCYSVRCASAEGIYQTCVVLCTTARGVWFHLPAMPTLCRAFPR